jgi:hypothetical protein
VLAGQCVTSITTSRSHQQPAATSNQLTKGKSNKSVVEQIGKNENLFDLVTTTKKG